MGGVDNTGGKVEFYAARPKPPDRLSRSVTNAVRIIGGQCRGRVVRFPPSEAVRPTPDRVRETLFNWLGRDLAGRTTLELYAGSGALSLEALSRGAVSAVAVDRDPKLIAALRTNAELLGLEGLEARRGDARRFVTGESRMFDVVFLDPPFADDPWEWLLPASAARLRPGGHIYAEAGRALVPPSGLDLVRSAKAGRVVYHLFGVGP